MKLAILLVRGRIGTSQVQRSTLDHLGLRRKHSLSIVEDTPTVRGQLRRVKDCVTWGTVSVETLKQLQARSSSEAIRCALHPPRGGYERKGVKTTFACGGALGDRGEKMDALVQRML